MKIRYKFEQKWGKRPRTNFFFLFQKMEKGCVQSKQDKDLRGESGGKGGGGTGTGRDIVFYV